MKYKTSNYNYFIDRNGKKLLFNGLTGSGFSMKIDEYNSLLPLLEDLNKFENEYPEDVKKFHKLGYIVENDFDELAFIKYKNREATLLDNNYRLTINPTLECNFNCWYCYETHPEGYMDEKTIEKIKNHICYMVEKEKISSLLLDWFGGEPLLYFYEVIYPISMYAKKICKKNNIPYQSQMTTNAFCINKEIK